MGNSNVLELNGNCMALNAATKVAVGLDVHKNKINAALCVDGGIVQTWVMPYEPQALCATLRPLLLARTVVAYEAGPTGYGLARALRKEGFRVEVAAPGKTPRPANPGNKSDRLDCRQLARYAYNGLLRSVAVPTRRQELDRQVMRLREQTKKKVRRVKQQIKSLLLQYGVGEPEGLADWTCAAVQELKQLEVERQLRVALQVMVEQLELLQGQMARISKRLKRMAAGPRYSKAERLLQTVPGVGPLTAMHFTLELYRPERFDRTEQVASYLGLAPQVRQSGQSRREGPLLKGGCADLRAMLVQAAWAWVGTDEGARRTYRRLVGNTGCSQKAIVGMARRLAITLWCMLVRGEPYRGRGPQADGA